MSTGAAGALLGIGSAISSLGVTGAGNASSKDKIGLGAGSSSSGNTTVTTTGANGSAVTTVYNTQGGIVSTATSPTAIHATSTNQNSFGIDATA